MGNKEKWVKFFEQVVGRKPSLEEFTAAKAVDFDLKQIRSIAGLDQVSSAELEVSVRVEEVVPQVAAEPIVESTPPVEPMFVQPEVAQQASVQTVQPNYEQELVYTAPAAKPVLTKGQKLKRLLIGSGALLVLGLGAGYYYMDQETGPEVTVEAFSKAFDSNDYDQMAKLLSSKDSKWSKEETKGFLDYLASQDINLKKELEKLVDGAGQTVFNDERGNKLLGLKEVGKKFGIFPEYQVVTYPVDLLVSSNLDELTVDGKKIEKNKEANLGQIKFSPKDMGVTAKTDLGDLKTSVSLDLETIEKNQAKVSMVTVDKNIVASLPEDLGNPEKVKLIVNGKEVSDSLSKELSLLNNQQIEVYSIFTFEGNEYTTDKAKINTGTEEEVTVELTLSADAKKRVDEAIKAKKAKEDAAKQAAEAEKEKARQLEDTKNSAYNFLTDYRKAVYDSIRNRNNTYASYYDTNSAVYQGMVDYTVNGGANAKKVDYLSPSDFSVMDIKQESNDTYAVTMYNTFTEHYFNGRSDYVAKHQTFYLRKDGDSFKIYDITERIVE